MSEIDRMINEDRKSLGTGWLGFAGGMLVVGGVFKILDALRAFKYDDEVSDRVQTVIFENDPKAWGWVWLLVGIVLIAAGFGVTNRAQWARWVGIGAAAVASVVNYASIFFEPILSLIFQGLMLAVIYGLFVYGRSWDDVR